jgi:Cohesin domain/Dockerin type I domain
MISGFGSPAVSDLTGPLGVYTLSGFGSGVYSITPSKSGTVNNSISSFDAALVAGHTSSVVVLSASQRLAADVSGDGTISSFDAAEIARYAVGLSGPVGSSGTWKFNPVNRTYLSVTSDLTNEDYTAFLMGEVSGNWMEHTNSRPIDGPQRDTSVAAPHLVTSAGSAITIPITVQGAVNKGLVSYEFDLRYDPSVIEPLTDAVDLAGTVSRGLTVVVNTKEPGLLRVVVYGPMPIYENGVLLNLKFTCVGTTGSVSPLVWERIVFNEGEPQVNAADGQVDLFLDILN